MGSTLKPHKALRMFRKGPAANRQACKETRLLDQYNTYPICGTRPKPLSKACVVLDMSTHSSVSTNTSSSPPISSCSLSHGVEAPPRADSSEQTYWRARSQIRNRNL